MKRKLLSMLVLLMTAISVAWGQEESYLYLEVNSEDNTAVLRYGSVQDTTPYYEGSSYDWVGDGTDAAKSSVTSITVAESCKNFAGTILSNLFSGFTELKTINDLKNLNTANVTDMCSMFEGCWQLASLDLSGWNTEKVTSMSGMFNWCESLTSLNVSGWNTGKVTNMSGMFFGCSQLASLTFGEGWNTGKVTNMSGMFQGCSQLASLDVSGWNTESVTNMSDRNHGVGSPDHIQESDISMLYYLSHSHFI